MLDKVKADDKVKFRVDKINGAYTVVELDPVQRRRERERTDARGQVA
jgi:hypothetical protein